MQGNLLGTTDKPPKPLSPTKELPILPDEVIEQILVRVPASTLVKLKIVCKSWNALISNPEFVSDHLHRSRADPILVYRFRNDNIIRIISSVQSLFKNPFVLPTEDGRFEMDDVLQILGSCNGLICLGLMSGRFLGSIRLWNPCTRSASDWLKIREMKHIMYGFGYDHVHDSYKFLEGCWQHGYKVHTFGSNSWTTIAQQHPVYDPQLAIGTFLYGTLNWAVEVRSGSNVPTNVQELVILSFDLVNENFCLWSLPDIFNIDEHFDPAVGVLRNRLCVCLKARYRPDSIVWVMEEYGVQESWTKLMTLSLEREVYPSVGFYSLKITCMTENDNVLAVSFSPNRFLKLVIIKANDGRTSQRIFGQLIFGVEGHWDCYVYHESLVSPSHLGLPSFRY